MRVAFATLAFAGGLLAACGEASVPADHGDHEAVTRVELADLADIGYVHFDEDARPLAASGATADVAPGLNVFTDQVDAVVWVDASGAEVARLEVPERTQLEHAEPLRDGWLTVSVDQGWDRFAADGAHRWSLDGNAHHDVAEREDGSLLLLAWEERRDRGRRVRFDRLLEVSADGGDPRELWSSFGAREALRAHHPALPLDVAPAPGADEADTVYDYHHVNTVEVLRTRDAADPVFPDGALLLCARNASLVFVLDPEDLDVLWSFGPGELDFPHAPTLTPRGTVLVFDNGWHRGWSRALEVDPRTDAIVWEYAAERRVEFFTKKRGSAQRLANGNTLLCEADRGRAFEVTPAGAVVWSFANPLETNPDASSRRRRRFYRFWRVPVSAAPR